jgi:hypothetical protein
MWQRKVGKIKKRANIDRNLWISNNNYKMTMPKGTSLNMVLLHFKEDFEKKINTWI